MRGALAALLAGAALAAAGPAPAHPLAPSLLELREGADGAVTVRLKTPRVRAPGADVAPVLPEGCTPGAGTFAEEGSGFTVRFEARCPAGLVGATLGVAGLGASGTDALVRVELSDGRSVRAVLTPARPTFRVPARERPAAVARDYGALGAVHIAGGLDHLAFVLGLVLLAPTRRALLGVVTAFTAGHSVTLSWAALGGAPLPARPVEMLIAASVVALAVELVRAPRSRARIASTAPWLLAFGFGLLHGLGFAGALREVGLPADAVPLALLSFNLGIELGQLAFVAALLALAALAAPWKGRLGFVAERLAPYAIGSLGAFWLFDRGWPGG